jgi:hypothetical protein
MDFGRFTAVSTHIEALLGAVVAGLVPATPISLARCTIIEVAGTSPATTAQYDSNRPETTAITHARRPRASRPRPPLRQPYRCAGKYFRLGGGWSFRAGLTNPSLSSR